MTAITPRPTLHQIAAADATPEIIAWLGKHDISAPTAHKLPQIVASLYDKANGNSFMIGRLLDYSYSWPVDFALIEIFERNLNAAHAKLDHALKQWVVASGVRFKPKLREAIRFRVDNVTRAGRVHLIMPERAQALVDISANDTPELIRVNAEEVLP